MKKQVFIGIAVCVALSSCVKESAVSFEKESAKKEISFSSPVMAHHTKAQTGEMGATYNTSEDFLVWGVYHEGSFSSWATSAPYMVGESTSAGYKGVVVKHGAFENNDDPGTGGWHSTDKIYYWPKKGMLSFAAASPADLASVATYGNDGLKISSFTQSAATIADQIDVLYSTRTLNKNTSKYDDASDTYDGVDIAFNHALSKLKFTAASGLNSSSPIKLTITKVEILGALNKGSFAENVTDDASCSADPAWTTPTSPITTDYSNYTAWEGSLQLTNSSTGLADSGLILIPQTIPTDAKIKVTYSITSGTTTIEGNTSEGKLSVSGGVEEWAVGTCYTYNITITLEEIYFAPSVSNWADGGEQEINI